MKTAIAKASKLTIAALVALAMLVSLCACGGKSSEEVIREGVSADFETIKNFKDNPSSEILGNLSDMADLEQFGIDGNEFFTIWFDGFDYQIDEITIQGDSATVKVTLTIKSFEDALNRFTEEINKLQYDEEYIGLAEEEIYKKLGPILLDCIKQAPLFSPTVELPYVLKDGTWTPGSDFSKLLTEAIYGDMLNG